MPRELAIRVSVRVRVRVRVEVRVRARVRVAAARLPVGFVAYQPLARGILLEEYTQARLVRTQHAVHRLCVALPAAEGVGVVLALPRQTGREVLPYQHTDRIGDVVRRLGGEHVLCDGHPNDELEELLTVERLVARLFDGALGQWRDLLLGVGIARHEELVEVALGAELAARICEVEVVDEEAP